MIYFLYDPNFPMAAIDGKYVEQFLRRAHDCYGYDIKSNKDPNASRIL